jgi:hypothetical protein
MVLVVSWAVFVRHTESANQPQDSLSAGYS